MVRTRIELPMPMVLLSKLRAVEHFADGWVMVKGRPLRMNVYQTAQKALALLHADGFVHGDVRETNIMV